MSQGLSVSVFCFLELVSLVGTPKGGLTPNPEKC